MPGSKELSFCLYKIMNVDSRELTPITSKSGNYLLIIKYPDLFFGVYSLLSEIIVLVVSNQIVYFFSQCIVG